MNEKIRTCVERVYKLLVDSKYTELTVIESQSREFTVQFDNLHVLETPANLPAG